MAGLLMAGSPAVAAEPAPSAVDRLIDGDRPSFGPGSLLPGGGIQVPTEGAPFGDAPRLPDEEGGGVPDDDPIIERAAPEGPPPPVTYGEEGLPAPVRATRQRLIEAARSGEVEAMRPLVEATTPPPRLSSIVGDDDPIDLLRAEAGDDEGREVLAILLDVLDAGWVHLDAGTPTERYVWPYFAAYSPDDLTPRQLVEVMRVMTAGDFEAMRAAGGYVFFRAEIGADGRWISFLTGE